VQDRVWPPLWGTRCVGSPLVPPQTMNDTQFASVEEFQNFEKKVRSVMLSLFMIVLGICGSVAVVAYTIAWCNNL
jgi:hypothetical protein